MTILALDAAGRAGGVCILQKGTVVYNEAVPAGLTHSQTLLCLVQKAMETCDLSPKDIDAYGVTAGPGSFTGLRIGLSLVKGLAQPFGTPVAPVSTLRALALGSGCKGTVVTALDARRGEVYWAPFDGDNGCERLGPDAAGPAESLRQTLAGLPAPVTFVGDGAAICYTIYKEDGANMPDGGAVNTGALGAARLAHKMAHGGRLVPAAAVNPEYLRLSQAERERLEKQHSLPQQAKGE